MANKYGSYNMEVIKRHYDDGDLHELWLTAEVTAKELRKCAGSLNRKEGTLYPWLLKLSEDLKDLADACYDARHLDEFPELLRR